MTSSIIRDKPCRPVESWVIFFVDIFQLNLNKPPKKPFCLKIYALSFLLASFLLCEKQMKILSLYFLFALICFCFFLLCEKQMKILSQDMIRKNCLQLSRPKKPHIRIYVLCFLSFLLCEKQREILLQKIFGGKNCILSILYLWWCF